MQGCNATINFCEGTDGEILAPYLDPILSKLIGLLQSPYIFVVQQAITAVAAVADCAQQHFLKYYDTFLPFLKSVLKNAQNPEHKLLRGKAMECISFIGAAVGKEKFLQDVGEVIELLMKLPEDASASYTIAAWSRICNCLREGFVPYLPVVMPPLFQTASLAPDVTVTESDPKNQNQSGWEFVNVYDKAIGIHTAKLEDKATACNLILCYVTELKESFFPYVDQVAKLFVPLIKFYYHDGVRGTAVATMSPLMECATTYLRKSGGDMTYPKSLFNYMLTTLYPAMIEEPDVDILGTMLEAIYECLDFIAEPCMTAEDLQKGTALMRDLIIDIEDRRKERADKKGADDFDEEEQEKVDVDEQKDEEILASIAEVITRFVKYHKEHYLPFVPEIFPKVLELLQPNQLPTNRHAALCICDDLIEHAGAPSGPLIQHFIGPMMTMMGDQDKAVRQAAVYGVGVCAQFGGSFIAPYLPDILNRLTTVIRSQDATSRTYVYSTENAISSVGKICRYQAQVVNNSQLLPLWLSMLPTTKDKSESPLIYDNLCYFIESNNADLLGPGYSNLPKILSIFGAVLETELINEQLKQRIVAILKQMQKVLPTDALQGVWATLSDEHKHKLTRAVTA
jgi:hypothetical protein